MQERIVQKLQQSFNPSTLEVIDESHQHKGHVGARAGGESHFRVKIKSDMFSGKTSLECHRMIYDVLASEMQEQIHALAIKIIK